MTETELAVPAQVSGTFVSFIEYVREPGSGAPPLSPKRFSEEVHIDLATLAEQAHVQRNTISMLEAGAAG